jgi:hypothetical protein
MKRPVARIRILVSSNPKKPGTKAHYRFSLYKDGMTPSEFLAAGGLREDLRYDEAHGFIAIPAEASTFAAATQTSNRSAAVNRIRNLLNKTVENGCTEQEAMAAAEMAGKLMDKYGVDMSETEIREEKCTTGIHGAHRARPHPSQWCANQIAKFCNCVVWHRRGTGQINFFGLPADVEVATYLLRVIEGAMDRSYLAYRNATHERTGMRLRNTFMAAFADRVNARLGDMLKARHTEDLMTTSGTSLMVVKNAVVKEQWDAQDLKLGKAKTVRIAMARSDAARAAGQAAGNKVHLGTAVTGGASQSRITQ